MSKFIDWAYSKGIVQPVSEAFLDYPVENEWHKGRLDYIICEEAVNYNYDIGDIVFVQDYNYSDGRKGKNHLFVIIDKDKNIVPFEYFALILSSNLSKLRFKENVFISKGTKNKLKYDSVVKTDYIYKLTEDMISYKIGTVGEDKVNYYIELCKVNTNRLE